MIPVLLLTDHAENVASSKPTFDVGEAIKVAEDLLESAHNGDVEPVLEYLARPDGSVALTHVIQVRNEEEHTWYEAFVDAHDGKLLSINDFVAHATVRISFPFTPPSIYSQSVDSVQRYSYGSVQR